MPTTEIYMRLDDLERRMEEVERHSGRYHDYNEQIPHRLCGDVCVSCGAPRADEHHKQNGKRV